MFYILFKHLSVVNMWMFKQKIRNLLKSNKLEGIKKRARMGSFLFFMDYLNYGVIDKVNHMYFTSSSPPSLSVAYLIPTLALSLIV